MLVGLAAGMAEGLAAIHSVGLVHRDLKPSNVILSAEGPRLIDFGIAHHPDATSVTATGVVVGSPGWMAPEQLLGNTVGTAADVWAWGATVAYASTGQAPFGTGPTPEVSQRVVSGIAKLDGVPEPLADHVRSALTPDPGARPTAAQLLAVTTSTSSPDPISTTLADTWQWANAGTVVHQTTGRRGRRWLVPAALAAALATAAALTALLAYDRADSRSPASGPPASTTSTQVSKLTTSSPRQSRTTAPTAASPATPTDPWSMANFRPSKVEPAISDIFRAFSGQPNYIPDFPLTMNGCGTRAMRTHWRSVGQAISVGRVDYSDTPENATRDDATKVVTATGGWIDTGGCQQPVFFVNSDGASTLVDVTFETRVYDAAP